MRNVDDMIKNLPPERRARIEGEARQLIGEEMALRQLRKARQLTQKQMARSLGVGQDSISRLECRTDLLLSTLQSYVEAMGGSLRIIAEFKDGYAELSGLGLNEEEPVVRKDRAKSRQQKPARRQKRHLALAHAND